MRFRYFQVLVGTGDLLFQLVEFRIAKNFPPVSAARLIPGTRRETMLGRLSVDSPTSTF